MIKVLEFADVINRFDFIDTIIQYADPSQFEMSVCVRSEDHRIEPPVFDSLTKHRLLPGNSRMDVLSTSWRLARLLREWKIDVLHAHHFDQMVIGWLATRFARRTRLVLGRHYSDSIYRSPNAFRRKALMALEQIVNRGADRIIVPSRMIAEILINRQGVDSKKVDIVYYGFVTEKYDKVSNEAVTAFRSELGLDGRFVLGNFSRLHEEKGHKYLLEALSRVKTIVPNVLLLVVGEGVERSFLERQIKKLGLENNVRLLGWRNDAMVAMASVDIVVQSTLQEAFSQVMCEAMWLSKPLVMTDVSGAADVIQDGTNGLIVPSADADRLAEAIVSLAKDDYLRKELGTRGHDSIVSDLRIESVIRNYENSFRLAIL